MTVVIEYNGSYIMGLVLDENGETKIFDGKENAETWAKENCSFSYKVVEL